MVISTIKAVDSRVLFQPRFTVCSLTIYCWLAVHCQYFGKDSNSNGKGATLSQLRVSGHTRAWNCSCVNDLIKFWEVINCFCEIAKSVQPTAVYRYHYCLLGASLMAFN
jgi:hypothetical protein